MNAKTCRQCGELKPLSQYRKYYGGRAGHYTTCTQCEKINSRLKYLETKESLNEAETVERDKILKLYEVQQACGLRPPRRGGRRTSLMDDLDNMIGKYVPVAAPKPILVAPPELVRWLDCALTEEPEFYLDTIYEQLCETYRPMLKIDNETMMPVYDESHKATLDAILKRFCEYEDKYYEEDN